MPICQNIFHRNSVTDFAISLAKDTMTIFCVEIQKYSFQDILRLSIFFLKNEIIVASLIEKKLSIRAKSENAHGILI